MLKLHSASSYVVEALGYNLMWFGLTDLAVLFSFVNFIPVEVLKHD